MSFDRGGGDCCWCQESCEEHGDAMCTSGKPWKETGGGAPHCKDIGSGSRRTGPSEWFPVYHCVMCLHL